MLTKSCGSAAAADVFNRLFDIALQDPHYLRFGYRPDCRLHGGGSVSPDVPVPSQPPAVPRGETAVVSHSPQHGHIPAHGGRLSTALPAVGDRKQRIYQPRGGGGSSGAFKHRQSSFVAICSIVLLTAAAVHPR